MAAKKSAPASFTVPGMSIKDGTEVAAMLQDRLNALTDLHLTLKHVHWNVVGPHFIAVHEMLDTFRSDLDEHVDTIAERAAQLGGFALGTTQAVAKATPLKPYPTDISRTRDHLAALIERYALAAKLARAAIDESSDAGDADTADIFTAYSRTLDKQLWFLEAHTQTED